LIEGKIQHQELEISETRAQFVEDTLKFLVAEGLSSSKYYFIINLSQKNYLLFIDLIDGCFTPIEKKYIQYIGGLQQVANCWR
jgi:hypothetical protein